MNKKLSAVEIMYHASSYRHLAHTTNYECEAAKACSNPLFNRDLYQTQYSLYAEPSKLTELIHARETCRTFSEGKLSQADVLPLLFNAYSLKTDTGSFTIPQAGGLMVMSLLVLENKQSHWECYRYDPINYRLIKNNDPHISIESFFYTQSVEFATASHCVIVASRLQLFSQVYLARAYKFACLQAGHLAQNLILTALDQKIRSITLGSLIEDEIVKGCHLDKDEYPLYAIMLGR